MAPAPGQRPKAYSYIRFSTPEQSKGDSYRRQLEKAEAYAQAHDLALDRDLTFKDLGKSGFTGANAQRGALKAFRRAVEDGEITKGSYLLVESFDRLSRMDPWDALPIFQEIINAGITLVTLKDQREWSRAGLRDNPFRLMESLLDMHRGYEESARKSQLLRDTYRQKRKRVEDGDTSAPFTRRLPAWLQWDQDRKRFILVKDRAKLLLEIFRKADAGWGKHRIAREFNSRGINTWGKAKFWHASYIQKLLTSPAVVGTFVPHETHKNEDGRRIRKPLKPVDGYWPAAIDADLFERVRAQAAATSPRGRNVDTPPRSVFAGLMKCAKCGGAVTRVSKGTHVYLVCSRANAKAKGCAYHAVPYEQAEHAMRGDNARVITDDAPGGMDTRDIDKEIVRLEREAEGAEADALDLARLAARDASPLAQRAFAQKEAEHLVLLQEARELRAKRQTLASANVKRRLDEMRMALTADPLDILEANTAMKRALKAVVLDAEMRSLMLHWHHSDVQTEGPPIVPLSVSGWQRETRKRRRKR